MEPVMKAVIPAAGLGTRFLPATKATPKEMLPVVDKPAIQYAVEEAVDSGITDILIVTGRGKRAVEDHFDLAPDLERTLEAQGRPDEAARIHDIGEMADIHFIRQREPLGLGHAVLCARPHVGDAPFAVLLGDDIVRAPVPAVRQLVQARQAADGAGVVAVEEVAPHRVAQYGIVDPGDVGAAGLVEVRGLVEKPAPADAPSDLGILGRYVLPPSVFDHIDAIGPGRNGEIQLTDALDRLARKEPLFALRLQGRRHDTGDRLGWLKANIELALERDDLGPALRAFLVERLAAVAVAR